MRETTRYVVFSILLVLLLAALMNDVSQARTPALGGTVGELGTKAMFTIRAFP